MIERLEAQKKLTANQWKLICTANIADLLDFFDFFLIGYVTAALTKEWQLPYWQGGAILLASGLGAVPGAVVWGWLGDRIGRRTVFIWSAVTISLATGIMVFTPGPDGFVPGWLFMMRYWVPESPRWLMRMGRMEEARKSLAWALMIDPKAITLPAAVPATEKTRWLDLFKYPRLVAAGCLTGMTQTGGASLGLWGATLLVVVLNTTPAHAAGLMVWVGLSGIVGRFFVTALIEPLGRRGAGTLVCVMAGLLMVMPGYF